MRTGESWHGALRRLHTRWNTMCQRLPQFYQPSYGRLKRRRGLFPHLQNICPKSTNSGRKKHLILWTFGESPERMSVAHVFLPKFQSFGASSPTVGGHQLSVAARCSGRLEVSRRTLWLTCAYSGSRRHGPHETGLSGNNK